MASQKDNPKGFFEDKQLVEINDRIFAKASNHWSSIQFIEPADLLGPRFQKEQKAAREFLERKLAQGNPIGLKDPRLCRTLPLWQKIFVEMGIRVGYLMPFRNPFEIAASLEQRDGISVDYGLTLWGSYQTDAMRHTEGKSRLFVGFHQLLENSGRELARISEFLETAWNPDAQSNLEYEKKFLDSDLRHHVSEWQGGASALLAPRSRMSPWHDPFGWNKVPRSKGACCLGSARSSGADISPRHCGKAFSSAGRGGGGLHGQ